MRRRRESVTERHEPGYPVRIYENGIMLRDAVWFDLELSTHS